MPLLDALVDELARRELLLILDNCEHVAEGAPRSRTRFSDSARRSACLPRAASRWVSRRARLRARAARNPGRGRTGGRDRAVRVRAPFLDRGHAVRRDLAVDADGLTTVARICRELDGLPLAIELAAAHAKVLGREIADRLDNRMRFLRSWRRVADARHQTLRAPSTGATASSPTSSGSCSGSSRCSPAGSRSRLPQPCASTGTVRVRWSWSAGSWKRRWSSPRSVRARRATACSRPSRSSRASASTTPGRASASAADTPSTFSTWQPGRTGTCWSSRATNSGKGWRSSMPSETTCTRRWSGRSRPGASWRCRSRSRFGTSGTSGAIGIRASDGSSARSHCSRTRRTKSTPWPRVGQHSWLGSPGTSTVRGSSPRRPSASGARRTSPWPSRSPSTC